MGTSDDRPAKGGTMKGSTAVLLFFALLFSVQGAGRRHSETADIRTGTKGAVADAGHPSASVSLSPPAGAPSSSSGPGGPAVTAAGSAQAPETIGHAGGSEEWLELAEEIERWRLK